jgi:uncharacterized repeat protein (TIGR01451 family)/fimbrial isopeptide formation D2 family protein
MTASETVRNRHGDRSIGIRLLAVVLLLLAAHTVQAQDCSDYPGGLLDGFAGTPAPAQLQIDRNCTVRNYPASNPLGTNFSFLTQPGQTDERWIIVFDNVVHTGQMACNAVAGHRIWFTNGSSTTIQEGCQNLLIPVEKIDKQNPAGRTTAVVGEPFTYRLTLPVLFDPATQTVINTAGSLNDLHGVTVWDDLNATGADLSYVSHAAYWLGSGTPVSHTFSNVGGLLTFDDFPIIPAGEQIVIELTVVLDNTPANAPGTQFVNTAKWDFGRLIDGTFYEPLPGEWGVTPPMTIAVPELALTKTGPATLNLLQPGDFTLDVLNVGNVTAWNATLLDRLPDGPDGSMCDAAPTVVSAQVFASDGVTPVPGKGPLTEGSDFSISYDSAPRCELSLTMLTAASAIGPGERLIVSYRTQLDADTDDGVTLTNVAGATEWFSADAGTPGRQTYTRTLTDGTVGVLDHEDAHTVTAALTGFFFEKSVENLTTGVSPTATANPGDTLRYTLRLRTTDSPLDNVTIYDDLGVMNATPVFAPGTLTLVPGSVPPGADTGNTDPGGGTNGAGILEVGNVSLPPASETFVRFDITLLPSLDNGLVVLNQADLIDTVKIADSDDPNVNGQASPDVTGDEDPTRVTIVSAPAFLVQKVSTDITGDPDVLLAGETLRYTLTVENVVTEDAVDVLLTDQVPANTVYVADSTTLNGTLLADVAGVSPLVDGILLSSPADPTPGTMPAAPAGNASNVATVTFDVVVDPDVVDGTVISNQGFVSAVAGGITDQPSDDPDTPIPDDPTRDIVGNLPLLYAEKAVALHDDMASPGIVDPGDVLRYTITVYNSGGRDATEVLLTDQVPANTTYVPDSTLLNGLPVGQPDGGVPPLSAGIPMSSSDRTPPLPAPTEGTISVDVPATLQFDLRVDDGVPAGTLISNQAVVTSADAPDLLTDGDGNPATGPEPTVVVVGDGQRLSISKQVAVVGGGAALAGSEVEYTVRVTNVASVPAFSVVITDDLDAATPGFLAYVDQSATMDGQTAGVSVAGTVVTADYSAVNGPLEPGESVVLRFRAAVNPNLAIGTRVVNTGVVDWNTPVQTASATVYFDIGGVVGYGTLNGAVWHDVDFDDALGASERLLEGWTVDLYRDDQRLHTVLTDADGAYRIAGLDPNDISGDSYELRFSAPGAGAGTATLGRADSPFTNGPQRISDIVVAVGSSLPGLNLPIDPNGVVYDAIQRTPVAGATLTLRRAGSGAVLPADCFDDPAQQNQITDSDGWYKFDLNFSDPACPSGGSYLIDVQVPGTGFVAGFSQIIPPLSDISTLPFSVPACPGGVDDAVLATGEHCEAQASEFAPGPAVPARDPGTAYHVHLTLDDSRAPGSSQLFNNHIALDPDLEGAVTVTKTTQTVNVSRGQMVPYTITFTNILGGRLQDLSVVDRYPAGFRYVDGSANIDGVPAEPAIDGLTLTWSGLSLAGFERRTIRLLLAVSAGVTEGEFVNRAQVTSSLTGNALSGEAAATVRVVPDPSFDCTDVTGKVFDDTNRNGVQDPGERGLQGIRLVTARGLYATTDQHGRYHITCAVTPREDRGSNFILKLDDRTLPSGFRLSTDQVQVKRATRGKALRFNYGASIHRVVGLDMADAVFEPGTTELRPQWKHRIDLLLNELRKAPATLRLSYVADVEDPRLVEQRLAAMKQDIIEAWEALDCCYQLTVEPEVFWRRGGPPERPVVQVPGSR